MAQFDSFKFKYWDDLSTLRKLIHRWTPNPYTLEKDYERSLASFLRTELKGIKITQQYAVDRIRFDIVLNDSIAIELKCNLIDIGDFQRLLGQLLLAKRWSGHVLVLLLGNTDPDILDSLNREIRDLAPSSILPHFEGKYSIVSKLGGAA